MLELDGQQLTLEEVARVAQGEEQVSLAASARERMEASRRVVERIVAESRVVYGVNTGFGKLSDVTVPADELRELQLNLVRSHAHGGRFGRDVSGSLEGHARCLRRAHTPRATAPRAGRSGRAPERASARQRDSRLARRRRPARAGRLLFALHAAGARRVPRRARA